MTEHIAKFDMWKTFDLNFLTQFELFTLNTAIAMCKFLAVYQVGKHLTHVQCKKYTHALTIITRLITENKSMK